MPLAPPGLCNANHKALELHDSYRTIIPYVFLYVNEIQHYSSDFNAVFVVVFVCFVLVFIWNVIFSLTFMVLTAILDLVKFFCTFSTVKLYTVFNFMSSGRDQDVSF